MENTIQPPSISPTPASRKTTKFVAALILLVVVIATVLAFRQGSYLRTRVLPNQTEQSATTEQEQAVDLTVDQYTKLESFCANQKEFYIQNTCGYATPEHDYHCRTQEAEAKFQDCLTSTAIEDVELYEQAIQQRGAEEDDQ